MVSIGRTIPVYQRLGAPTVGVIQMPAIGAQAGVGWVSGTSHVMTPAAEKHPILAAVQTDHGAEIVALGAVGAAHAENKILPRVRAPWVFHGR